MHIELIIVIIGLAFSTEATNKTWLNQSNPMHLPHILKKINETNSDIVNLYSIGKSVQGRDLWVLEIAVNRSLTVPSIKIVANIKGTQVISTEVTLRLITYLTEEYKKGNVHITHLLNSVRIHFLPIINPDGYNYALGSCTEGRGRNANGKSLNVNFPTYKVPSSDEQPEVTAIKDWMDRNRFVLSIALGSGTKAIFYPYNKRNPEGAVTTTDDDVFGFLAEEYARVSNLKRMEPCEISPADLVTNGASWYSVTGTMQDYNYYEGCMEIDVFLSCCHYVTEIDFDRIWSQNLEALLKLIRLSQMGVKGFIKDSRTNEGIPRATVTISNREMPVISSESGEYWRLLRPGDYFLHVDADEYELFTERIVIEKGKTLHLDIYMKRKDMEYDEQNEFAYEEEETQEDMDHDYYQHDSFSRASNQNFFTCMSCLLTAFIIQLLIKTP